MRAIVLVSDDLMTDRRVERTCLTLQKCGYDVLLVGRRKSNSLPLSGIPYRTHRLKLLFNSQIWFYAELNIRLFFFVLFRKVDVIFANDLDTLPAGWLAATIRRKRLIYDSHEYFTEVPELQYNMFAKKVWLTLEKMLLPHVTSALTVNDSIADLYRKNFGIEMAVVRNMPVSRKLQPSKIKPLHYDNKKIILYQGALNIGRGLEQSIDAMHFIDNSVLVIIGSGDIEDQLKKRVLDQGLSEKVKFLGKIPIDELDGYTSQGDVGLCLMENISINYYFSLPNRIFDYLQAGIPVLASDLPEIARIVEAYKTGVLLEECEPQAIAEALTKMLTQDKVVLKAHLQTVAAELCWENEERKLIAIIEQQHS